MIQRPLFERFAQAQRDRQRIFLIRIALLWGAVVTMAIVVAFT
jgi:hypothetical protein